MLRRLFDTQAQSRHLDFAARWLQQQGKGYYTIWSSGHESNAALGLLSRTTDPALLHYRSGGFYMARAATARAGNPVRDVLLSLTSASSDPMSGGRHKVFGHPVLGIIPQTSTIASHLPRAVGLGYSLGLARAIHHETPWPEDAVVVCSFGDASVNHSTAAGAFNAAAYLTHRGVACPVLFVCEDNGLGISTKTPAGWTEAALSRLPGISYRHADGSAPASLLDAAAESLSSVRDSRRPAVLHLSTVRFMGHAGSDAESAYRSPAEIAADLDRDPLLATATALLDAGVMSSSDVLDRYEEVREQVMSEAKGVLDEERLGSRAAVMAPLSLPERVPDIQVGRAAEARSRTWGGRLPEDGPPLTLAQSINATLTDLMDAHPASLLFGQDVARKGGVYGVTRGLQKRFGGFRVFDTLLDEQTILGSALGAALAGFVPIPEIQYLAYVHNAEDQLRGEAASLRFFSNGQFQNGMVVRIAGLGYQSGFGGHFHNDNSVAVLRDIPGLVLAAPSHPADAPGLLRACFALAQQDGRVCVFLEPIATYHTRDLLEDGDGGWTAGYVPPDHPRPLIRPGELGVHGDGRGLLIVTFGNGVHLSRRAATTLGRHGVQTTVVDLRWLAPLPEQTLLEVARGFNSVLIVDETRRSGGVAEAVVAALVDGGHRGRIVRLTSADSFVPLGPAAKTVLVSEDDIVTAGIRASS